jgi:hypothetical protein
VTPFDDVRGRIGAGGRRRVPDVPDLDYSPETWVAIGTLVLAGVTLALAIATAAQVKLSRRALEGSVRPLLVDIPIGEDDAEPDVVSDDEGAVEIEARLRNGGTGLATIVGGPTLAWDAFPPVWGGVAQQLVVLPGETVRLTFRRSFGSAQSANEVALAATNFAFDVEYADVNGKQRTRTRAFVVQHPDEQSEVDLYVDRLEVSKRRLWWWRKPVTLTGRFTTSR